MAASKGGAVITRRSSAGVSDQGGTRGVSRPTVLPRVTVESEGGIGWEYVYFVDGREGRLV